MVLLTMGSVLLIAGFSLRQNTYVLVRDKTELLVDSIENRIRDHLDPVGELTRYLQGMIQTRQIERDDPAALGDAFHAALAAVPRATGLAYIDTRLSVIRVERDDRTMRIEDWSNRPEVASNVGAALNGTRVGWGEPLWSAPFKQTIIPITLPIELDGRPHGVLVSAILTADLARYLAQLATSDQTPFILYGENHVLAHPSLSERDPYGSIERPLPRLSEIGDIRIQEIWARRREPLMVIRSPAYEGHSVAFANSDEIYLYRRIETYGQTPWVLGIHAPASTIGRELEQLYNAAAISLLLLLLAAGSAVWIGKRIARPIMEIAGAAQKVQLLELESTPNLPRSRLLELDVAATAFNAMVAGLRCFELYVPKALVHRLLADADRHLNKATEGEVTVMFTDIEHFSSLVEHMSPAAIGAFLNQHFALLGECVDTERGTVDKFIGDSMMAFWGAPDVQPDHAARACRTAAAIRRAIQLSNAHRTATGLAPVRVRIGVSTGSALVGNIGAPGRVNYTIVGDTVNLAQRLEQLCKEIEADSDDVVILATAATVLAAGDQKFAASFIGERILRGRETPASIYRLQP
jgi:adenylate cyclase